MAGACLVSSWPRLCSLAVKAQQESRAARHSAVWRRARINNEGPFRSAKMGRAGETRRTPSLWPDRRHICRPAQAAVAEVLQEEALPEEAEREKAISAVAEQLAAQYPDLPTGKMGRDDRDLILWFLRDRKFDVKRTVTKLATMIKWRTEFRVDTLTDEDVAEQAATGKAYLHTCKDVRGRPVVVVNAGKHDPKSASLVEAQSLCVHIVEKALTQMDPPVERLLGIFDLRTFKQKNTDLQFIRFLIDMFFNYYPKRLDQVLFVDAPFVFQTGWQVFKPWLGKYVALVRFCTAEEVRKEYFTPDTIPEDFAA